MERTHQKIPRGLSWSLELCMLACAAFIFVIPSGPAPRTPAVQDCSTFLESRGISSDDLQAAVRTQAPWDGTKSTILLGEAHAFDFKASERPEDRQDARFFAAIPVGDFFRAYPDALGVAELGGKDAYYRAGDESREDPFSPRRIIHNALHNLTGMGDYRLAVKLGLNPKDKTGPREFIEKQLASHACGED
jgi:hypothetical protein